MSAWCTRAPTPSPLLNKTLKRKSFFAVGFETTTPASAVILLEAERLGLKTFRFIVIIWSPCRDLEYLGITRSAKSWRLKIRWIYWPAHVSAVIGSRAI